MKLLTSVHVIVRAKDWFSKVDYDLQNTSAALDRKRNLGGCVRMCKREREKREKGEKESGRERERREKLKRKWRDNTDIAFLLLPNL